MSLTTGRQSRTTTIHPNPATYRRGWALIQLGTMTIVPLHQDQYRMTKKLGFTGEAEGTHRSSRVHGGRRQLVGWKLLGWVLRLQGELKDIRQPFEKAIGGEAHGGRHSLVCRGGDSVILDCTRDSGPRAVITGAKGAQKCYD
jgi:hypothetical protein